MGNNEIKHQLGSDSDSKPAGPLEYLYLSLYRSKYPSKTKAPKRDSKTVPCHIGRCVVFTILFLSSGCRRSPSTNHISLILHSNFEQMVIFEYID